MHNIPIILVATILVYSLGVYTGVTIGRTIGYLESKKEFKDKVRSIVGKE